MLERFEMKQIHNIIKLGLFLLFIAIGSSSLKASHIIGAEIYYECLSPNSNFYKITIVMYRDCDPNSANFQDSIYVAVYDTLGNLVNGPLGLKMDNPPRDTLNNETYNLCLFSPPNICVEQAVYTGVYVFGSQMEPGGYYIAFQQCCRNYSITNILNPGDVGSSWYVNVPETAIATCNNSAVYNNYPPTIICLGDTFIYDHSATDPDGDSITYELCDAIDANFTDQNGAPNAYLAPTKFIDTFFPVTYATTGYPYSADNPIYAPTMPFTVDLHTGLMVGYPEQIGQYIVAVCASEYRNGELLSVNRRDFQFNIATCVDDVTAGFDVKVCGNNRVEFVNTSWHGTYYDWDFGVSSILTDTSTQENPIYVFPAPGTYDVSMIVNPSMECADTSDLIVEVPQLAAEFFPETICLYDTVEFADSSTSGDKSGTIIAWDWDFGDDSTSIEQHPAHAFSDSLDANGNPINVSMIITTDNGCIDTMIREMDFYPYPIITAGLDFWASYDEVFQLLAIGGAATYTWDPVDGITSPTSGASDITITSENPYVVDGSLYGSSFDSIVYVVTGISKDGCTAKDTLVIRIMEPAIAIPNAFSPNGDGQNDIIYLLTVGVKELVEFKIFNRWGQVVFETTDLSVGWDGNFKDKPQEMGNYAYIYKATTVTGETVEGNGDIALLR